VDLIAFRGCVLVAYRSDSWPGCRWPNSDSTPSWCECAREP